MVFLQQLQGAKAGMDTAALKSQCRAYLVGFKQLPHPAHSWSAFLHDLFASCIDNEFAAEIVAMALLGQNVLDEEDLPMVLDVRPINIDNAATHRCRWQAMLFIHALSIVFPTAVVNGHSELVLPFLDDSSSQVRYTAFTALYPNQSASKFLAFSDFYGNLAHSEQKLLAEKIAENYPAHEAAQILKTLVNQHKVQILGAFCKIAQRDHSAIELLLYAEFDIFTSEQHSAVNEALASGSRTTTMLELSNEGTLRQQLLNAYFVSGAGENAQVLNLSVVEWIARLDNNPLIKQQAIDFLLSISQEEGEAIANSIMGEKDFIIKNF
ncbi:MAG: hypothetical protein P8L98_07230 [Planctomycetota bacterium]|nr:hypothetical protein [Planctomycetota bacterium]MDG1404956.1 hypothetical protein [Planctomycetota bacterium]MDG2310354.1 hypothetical protein [Planctomycetota bacterium]